MIRTQCGRYPELRKVLVHAMQLAVPSLLRTGCWVWLGSDDVQSSGGLNRIVVMIVDYPTATA